MKHTRLSMILSADEMSALLSIIQLCAGCTTKEDLKEAVDDLKGLIGFEYFTSVHARLKDGDLSDSCHIVNIDYPEEWVRVYMEKKYHHMDPIVEENFSSFTVQYWADTYKARKPDREFVSDAEDFGLRSGYTSGVRNLAGTVGGLFSFAGDNIPRDERTRLLVETVTPHLYQALERIVAMDKLDRLSPLTARELEVLKWIASGKTTWETSVILGISDRTVKYHVNNVMKKLNTVTRTHAVAVATGLGLVDLG